MQSIVPAESPSSQPRSRSPRSYERLNGRKVEPSPLSHSQVSSPVTVDHDSTQSSPQPLASPVSPGAGPGFAPGKGGSRQTSAPQSPRERFALDNIATGAAGGAGTLPARAFTNSASGSPVEPSRSSPLATPRASDSRKPGRNISAPDPPISPPQSPAEAVPTARPIGAAATSRPNPTVAPRNSSIDSTVSATSSATSYSQPAPQDPMSPNPAEIAALIAAAGGSAEAVISQLIKDKKQAANQNAQLFRLVQKQRSLIYGLNQDLERAVQEKEKFRLRARDDSTHQSPARGAKVDALRKESPTGSTRTGSTISDDELPIQRHSATDEDTVKPALPSNGPASDPAQKADIASTTSQTLKPKSLSKELAPSSPGEAFPNSPITPVAPLMITKRADSTKTSPTESTDAPTGPSPSSFAARRSFAPRKSPQMSGPSSPVEEPTTLSPTSRKGPPAPLNLEITPDAPQSPKSANEYGPADHSGSEYDESELDPVTGLGRGRKKTRAEDDMEREILIKHEQESRSLSKKQKGSKPGSQTGSKTSADRTHLDPNHLDPAQYPLPKSPLVSAPNSPANSFRSGHLSPHASIAGMLSGPSSAVRQTFVERHSGISPPMSPGLPLSPRPSDRPTGAPAPAPRQPREGYITTPPADEHSNGVSPINTSFPDNQHAPASPKFQQKSAHTPQKSSLSMSSGADDTDTQPAQQQPTQPSKPALKMPKSPRLDLDGPKSPLSPTHAPPKSPMASPKSPISSPKSPRKTKMPDSAPPESSKAVPKELMVEGVFRGLVTEEHPTLLLPPNALPTISIKVTSSRLKPSRQSTIMLAGTQEEPVFTLGVNTKSNLQQLWRVEKPIMSLPQLDHHLRQAGDVEVKLPERSLFSGHAPAKIDARRIALENYFEALLDMQLNDQMGLVICKYFSTHVIPCEEAEVVHTAGVAAPQQPRSSPEAKIVKEGYLTKRGKQFGGWKARFFVLDEPVLRYYDAPGGSLQGTIKLYRAQIGRQSTHTSQSPSREGQSADNQFRHAFLIMEPKKKDASSHVRHVLCAESDQERDEWVYALLQYVNIPPEEPKSRPQAQRSESGSKGSLKTSGGKPAEEATASNDTDRFNSLQSVSYEEASQGEAPRRSASVSRADTSSPVSQLGSSVGSSAQPPPAISGPMKGAVIQDAGAWGNKSLEVPGKNKEKEAKKRSIWGIRDRIAEIGGGGHGQQPSAPTQSNTLNPNQQRMGYGNTHKDLVFGVPLQEAVEFCMAPGSNVCLPAVVYRCLTYLEAKGAENEEGIFRLSGSNTLVKQLKEKFNTEGDFDFLADGTYYDVHAVASLLKLYLRELPNTVLTRKLHLEFLSAMDIELKADRITAYCILAHRLPLPNWTLVRSLSEFLLSIVNNSQVNKMSVRNVGIVFAPTLNIPAPVFAAFLTDYESIFIADPPEDAPASYMNHSSAGPDEPRTPNMQAFGDMPTPTPTHQNFYAHPPGPGLPAAPNEHHRHTQRYSHMPPRVPTPSNPQQNNAPYETHTRATHDASEEMHRRPSNSSAQSSSNNPSGRPSYETALPDFSGVSNDPNRPTITFSKPGYETNVSFGPSRPPPSGPPPALPRQSHLVTPPERPKYASGIGQLEVMRDTKARRRESAMITGGANGAHRKSSMPQMDNVNESIGE